MTQSRGKLVTWKSDKGFGFIRPDEGGTDVFVHLRDFGTTERLPTVGDVIRYQRVADGKGRYRAADVHLEGVPRRAEAPTPRQHRRRDNVRSSTAPGRSAGTAAAIAVLFGAVLIILVFITALPVIVLPLYLIASLATYITYAFDKAAAMNRRWRTTENTLLLLGLAGGWPGALVAQAQFRHKSKKTAFLVAFWITVAANCTALAWACSARGSALIRATLY